MMAKVEPIGGSLCAKTSSSIFQAWKMKTYVFGYFLRRFAVFILFLGTATSLRSAEDETFPVYEPLFADSLEIGSVRLSAWIRPSEVEEEFEESVILPVAVGATPMRKARFSVAAKNFRWHDPARRRSLPVRIYHPSYQGGERFPVIVFSHGLGGSIDRCSYLGHAWASRGFIVVMLQHPGSDESIWKGKVRIRRELEASYRYNWSGRTRAMDIRFALDRLERLAVEQNWLASIMDFDRIGVGGYDLGCLAALLVSGQSPPDRGSTLHDPRVKAVLAMSPPIHRPTTNYRNVYASITIPAFFITGTEDDGIIGSTTARQRRIPFDFMETPDRYLVTLRGGDHQVYGGPLLAFRARNEKPFQAVIVRASSCFWQAVLTEDVQARATLNGYGLNSQLGGMAVLERKLRQTGRETEQAEPTAKSETESTVEEHEKKQTRRPSSETGNRSFPLTRIYRVVTESYKAQL